MNRLLGAVKLLAGSKSVELVQKADIADLNLTDVDGWQYLTGGPSWSGVSVNENTVLQMTTSWRCIRLISETIGTLPLVLYRKGPEGVSPAYDHKLYYVLHDQPNANMTSIEWVESMVVSLCVYGQAYNAVVRVGDRIAGIRPVVKQCVTPRVVDGDVIYTVSEDGNRREVSRADICPIRGFGAVGQLEGLPPYKLHSQSLALTVAAEKYGAEFFGGGGRVSGVFTGDTWPDVENVKLFDKLFQERGGKPLFTGGNYDYHQLNNTNNENQFIETREFQVRETANIWGVPADRVLSKGGDTYNNTEHRNLQFLQTSL